MNQQGLLYSLVAVDSDNMIMGHAALKFSHPGALIAESGVAFVLPEHRKLGLFGQFNQRFIEHAASSGLHGLYGWAVTSHIASQRMAAAHGFKDCGLFLGVFPGDVEFKKIAGKTQQRESGVLGFLALEKSEARNIYLPGPYQELAANMSESLGIPVGLQAPPLDDAHPQDHAFVMETTGAAGGYNAATKQLRQIDS